MRDRVQNVMNQARERWNGLEKGQKIRLVLAVVVLLVFLGATIFIMAKPNKVTLRSNLDPEIAYQIKNALEEDNIKSWITNGGSTVEIDEKNLDIAVVTLAIKNVPNDSSFTYEDALSNSGMGTTETLQRSNLLRAQETDLERMLMLFEGVSKASVKLFVPQDTNFFIEAKEESSASVVLTLSQSIDKNNWQGVARLICRSVKGLELKNVVILDQNYEVLYAGSEDEPGAAADGYDIERLRRQEIVGRVQSLLSPLYDDVKVAANIVVNTSKQASVSKTVSSPIDDSATGLVAQEQLEKTSASEANNDGAPGVEANNQATGTYQAGDQANMNINTSSSNTSYLHNEEVINREEGFGEVIPGQSSLAIAVYRYPVFEENSMTAEQLGGLTWEEFKLAQEGVENIQFLDTDPVYQNIRAATGLENVSIIGYSIPQFVDYVQEPLKIEQIVMFAIMALLILLLAIGVIRNVQTEELEEIEPELSVEDLLVSTQLEEEKEAEAQKLLEIDFGKDSETKKLIEQLVEDKPESVAQLLRNWLSEEWN